MIVLSLRTDKPEAEIGLFDNGRQLAYEKWQAHRQLAESLHSKIKALLASVDKDWPDIEAVACYRGPGSFTGLRIGLAVANALAGSLGVPVVGTTGDDWTAVALEDLANGGDDRLVVPEYGTPVHVTTQKK